MTHEELIAKQQLMLEDYEKIYIDVTRIRKELHGLLFSIGQPMNDNILQFNKDQLKWCAKLNNLIGQLPE